MSTLLSIRDGIRDFLRKFDEVTTPLVHFLMAYIMFSSINKMFGYSDFLAKGAVVFLLSVICALVSSAVVVLLGGVTIAIHCFAVSLDVGILFVLLFIVIYCAYIRMFKDTSFALALVPILCLWNIAYAAPVIVAIFAGFAGAVPAAFGVSIYFFAQYVSEAHAQIVSELDPEFQGYSYVIDNITKNKEMFLMMIVFAVVVMLTSLIYRMSFDYSWYAAIAVGSVCTILLFPVCGASLNVDVEMSSLVLGALLGGVVAVVVQLCKSVVDYAHKESVQFEDDDYYYYVKAIPKFSVAEKKKVVKKVTDAPVEQRQQGRNPNQRQGGGNPNQRQNGGNPAGRPNNGSAQRPNRGQNARQNSGNRK